VLGRGARIGELVRGGFFRGVRVVVVVGDHVLKCDGGVTLLECGWMQNGHGITQGGTGEKDFRRLNVLRVVTWTVLGKGKKKKGVNLFVLTRGL